MHTSLDTARTTRRFPFAPLLTRTPVLAGLLAGTLAISPAALHVHAAPSAAPVTVTVWDISQDPQKTQFIADADAFNKAHPGIHVQIQFFLNDPYKTKLQIAIGAHQGPDIFMGWGGGILKNYIDAEAVVDLTSALNADPAWKNRYTPSVFGPVTFNGHIYGIPYDATTPEVLFYNKAIFKQYNLSIPTTWPQLEAIIKTLKSHNIIPFTLDGKTEWPEMIVLQYLADRIGGSAALNDIALRKPGASFNSKPWIDAFTLAQNLVKENAFQNGFASSNWDTYDGQHLLWNGRTAMMFMGVWEIGNVHGGPWSRPAGILRGEDAPGEPGRRAQYRSGEEEAPGCSLRLIWPCARSMLRGIGRVGRRCRTTGTAMR